MAAAATFTRSMSAALIIVVVILVTGAAVTTVRRRRRGREVPAWEIENEANARFVPSADPHHPRCPRCHGRGKLAGLAGRECPVCQGLRHVRFGPGA
jgi:tRNA(Ile2) C34 agmatinyltransferase TiaS